MDLDEIIKRTRQDLDFCVSYLSTPGGSERDDVDLLQLYSYE